MVSKAVRIQTEVLRTDIMPGLEIVAVVVGYRLISPPVIPHHFSPTLEKHNSFPTTKDCGAMSTKPSSEY